MWNLALIGQAVLEKKIFENGGRRTDGRRTDDGPWLYYKLTNEPKGSGELNIKLSIRLNTIYVIYVYMRIKCIIKNMGVLFQNNNFINKTVRLKWAQQWQNKM